MGLALPCSQTTANSSALLTVNSAVSLLADLDCLHYWSTDHGIKFNTAKCKVLHMTRQEEILSTTPTQLVALWPQLGACY